MVRARREGVRCRFPISGSWRGGSLMSHGCARGRILDGAIGGSSDGPSGGAAGAPYGESMAGAAACHRRTCGERVDAPPDGATGMTMDAFASGPSDAPSDATVGALRDASADGSAGMPVTHLWRTSGGSGVRQILPKGRGSACLAKKVNSKKRTALRLLGIDAKCPANADAILSPFAIRSGSPWKRMWRSESGMLGTEKVDLKVREVDSCLGLSF